MFSNGTNNPMFHYLANPIIAIQKVVKCFRKSGSVVKNVQKEGSTNKAKTRKVDAAAQKRAIPFLPKILSFYLPKKKVIFFCRLTIKIIFFSQFFENEIGC